MRIFLTFLTRDRKPQERKVLGTVLVYNIMWQILCPTTMLFISAFYKKNKNVRLYAYVVGIFCQVQLVQFILKGNVVKVIGHNIYV